MFTLIYSIEKLGVYGLAMRLVQCSVQISTYVLCMNNLPRSIPDQFDGHSSSSSGYACLPQCHAGHSCSNLHTLCSGPVIDLTSMEDKRIALPYKQWVKCGNVELSEYHRHVIGSGAWLNDLIISAAQNMLHREYPHIGGFQNPILAEKLAMVPEAGEFIQVLNVSENHWLTISNIGCDSFSVKVYDSLGGRLPHISRKVVANILQCKKQCIIVMHEDVQKQHGGNDCGVFALAFATSLCNGKDPSKELYDQQAMRDHLIISLSEGKLGQFPTIGKRKPCQKSGIQRIPIYCICRLPDDGSEMIQCSQCDEWYHTSCIKVDKMFIDDSELVWNCDKC